MRNLLGLNDRTMGIGVCNGKLSDCQYPYEIISKQENSRQSQNYKKRYWLVVSNKENSEKEKNRSPEKLRRIGSAPKMSIISNI